MDKLSYFVWDPSPGMFDFSLPLLNRPILWYGFFFALGFFLGYAVLLMVLRHSMSKTEATKWAEKLSLYVITGGLIGARLGDVFLYQHGAYVLSHPMALIAIWEGGLASHGGAVGILVALVLFARKTGIAYFKALDWIVIPVALAAVCIRIGNFFNQEILGIPTQLSWGVLFLHPADGSAVVPRHPVQLYEAFAYLCISGVLWWVWRRGGWARKTGRLTGLFLVLVFGFRFLVEYVKVEQSVWVHGPLTMGQLLSVPFVLLGVFLLWRRTASKPRD